MKLGEGFIEVRADRRAFDGDLSDLAHQIRSGQGGAGDVSHALRDALVGTAFLAGAKKAADAASNLQQAVGGTEAVFGRSADAVGDWSKRADEAAGLSERAARELTAQIGGLLKGFGYTEEAAADLSIQLAQLGADLAATFGGRPEEAVQALAAAMRGETDPIERYGIAINQNLVNQKALALGLVDSAAKVDQHSKAQATLALITERSADAQGQFAREADTAGGQAARAAAKTENAAADLGDNLLPIYTKLNEVVGTVADAFGSLPEPVQTGLIALGGIAALSGPIKISADAMSSMASIARGRLSSGLETAGLRGLYLKDSLGAVTTVAGGPAVAALGLLAVALFDAKSRADEMRQAAKQLREEAEQTGDSLEEVSLRKLVEDLTSVERVRDAMDKLGVSFEDLREPLQGTRAEYQAWLDDLNREHPGDVRVEILTKQVAKQRSALDEARQSTEAADEATSDLGLSQDGTSTSTGNLTDQIKEQEDALKALLDATLAQFDANLGYRRSIDDVEGSLTDLTEAQREHGTSSEEYRDALLDAEGALLDQADAALRLYEDTAKANGETLTAQQRTAIYRGELERLRNGLAPGSPLRKALDDYIARLGEIPDSITTTLSLVRPTISGKRGDQLLQATGYAAGGDVMDGLFRVHDGELMRKQGEQVEVLAGSPTPIAGSDVIGAEVAMLLRLVYSELQQISGNTAGPTTGQRLRRVQTMAGAV